jgi:hypothetical protein
LEFDENMRIDSEGIRMNDPNAIYNLKTDPDHHVNLAKDAALQNGKVRLVISLYIRDLRASYKCNPDNHPHQKVIDSKTSYEYKE